MKNKEKNNDIDIEKEEKLSLSTDEVSEVTDEENADSGVSENKPDEKDSSEALQSEIDSLRDKLIRSAAEFDNFKKRTAKERDELFAMGLCSAVEKILPVKDNLERALASLKDADENILSGISMIDKQLSDILNDMGVEVIPAVGEVFDPMRHNAVSQDENENFGENTVSEEFMKGYIYKDKVIRHSMVKVSNCI